MSEEAKENLRRKNTGKTQSAETIAKRVEKLKGKVRSPEAIEKARQTLLRKKLEATVITDQHNTVI